MQKPDGAGLAVDGAVAIVAVGAGGAPPGKGAMLGLPLRTAWRPRMGLAGAGAAVGAAPTGGAPAGAMTGGDSIATTRQGAGGLLWRAMTVVDHALVRL